MTSARTIELSSGAPFVAHPGHWSGHRPPGASGSLPVSSPGVLRVALAPWIAPAVLAEYVHNVGIRLRRQFRGHTRHAGDATSIVRACIEACWNGRTFTASPGHFDMFWTRDLSFSVPSLLRLGHRHRVEESMGYALSVWQRRGRHITTTIHYFDRPGDVYEYGVDSLPLFM